MEKYDDILNAIGFFKQEYERIDKNNEDETDKLYYIAIAINALREQLPR